MRVFARIKKIFDKHCSWIYYNHNISNAVLGFHEMGFEIINYENVIDIYNEFQKDDILLDGVEQVQYILSKFNISINVPDYPDILKSYLGRKIWKDTINHINNHPELWPVFIKPTKTKKFTGILIKEPKDLIGCGNYLNNTEIYCSEPINFIYECRAFIYYDKLIDLRPYYGDYIHMNQLNTTIIKNALNDFCLWEGRPTACSLDFGVTDNGKTLFIELNSAYSIGSYGLHYIQYAKLISAFFSWITETTDECKF